MSKKPNVSARQFAKNFNNHFQYHPSDLRVMRMFTPLVDTIDAINIKKLKDITLTRPRGIRVPNALQPIVTKTYTHKKIPFEQTYAASKFIANKISPDLYRHLIKLNKDGHILDEQLENEFNDESWEMHINNNYTADDIVSVLHELGHEMALQHNILVEVPSITTEFLADKILGKYGIPAYLFTTAKVRRVQDMMSQGYAVEFITELFEEFEQNGKKMTPNIADKLGFYDLNALKEGMINEVPYFIGGASSLVIADNIRDKQDYNDTIKILSNRNIGKMRKLRELNVTPTTLIKAFEKNI